MSKQNEMMAKALKEYMQMRADDIAEVYEIMSIEDVKTRNAREDKYIEDRLNDVFARNMPEMQTEVVFDGDELGKSNPEVQKRLTEIMLTQIKKGETNE